MGFLKKFFGLEEPEPVVYPDIPENMQGVLMKKIGMHCASGCKTLVEGALKEAEGVQDFVVEAPPQDLAFVVFDPDKTNTDKLKDAIIGSGYNVREMEKIKVSSNVDSG